MNTPRISVILFGSRPGGLDVTLTGLEHQEFTDFELVFVDGLYNKRKYIVADECQTRKLRVTHFPPRLPSLPYDSIPAACNTAVAKAKGGLYLWTTDYTFLQPKALLKHWEIWEQSQGHIAGMGAHEYLMPPDTAFDLPPYAPIMSGKEDEKTRTITYHYKQDESEQYALDLVSGVYDAYMYSIFKIPISTPQDIYNLPQDQYFWHADPKLTYPVGAEITGMFLHLKNESMGSRWILDVNGLDELYTSHCYADTDLGYRLGGGGALWKMLDEDTKAYIINPRHIFPHLIWRSHGEGFEPHIREVEENPLKFLVAQNPYNLLQIKSVGLNWY